MRSDRNSEDSMRDTIIERGTSQQDKELVRELLSYWERNSERWGGSGEEMGLMRKLNSTPES